MPNKRSNRSKTKKFFCPFCESRLWRSGSPKYHFFYQDASQIRRNTGISRKKAALIASKNSTYLDMKRWIESFFCTEHGAMWLAIDTRNKDLGYDYRLAKGEDWLQTNKTIDPRTSNPSVSEFTLRMSRKL